MDEHWLKSPTISSPFGYGELKKGCRRFYDQLIQVDQITRHEKWINEMGYINDQEWNRYNTNINNSNEVTQKNF